MGTNKVTAEDQAQNQRSDTSIPWIGIAGAVISIAYLAKAFTYRMGTLAQSGPGVYPVFAGILFLAGSVGTIVTGILYPPLGEVERPMGRSSRRVLIVIASTFGYIVLLPTLGYLVAGFMIVLFTLHGMDMRSWLLKIGIGIALTFGSYLLFHTLLSIPLPQGIWQEILSG